MQQLSASVSEPNIAIEIQVKGHTAHDYPLEFSKLLSIVVGSVSLMISDERRSNVPALTSDLSPTSAVLMRMQQPKEDPLMY